MADNLNQKEKLLKEGKFFEKPMTDDIKNIQDFMESTKKDDYQQYTLDFIKKYNPYGHVVYFEPGFGKTRLACYIIDYFLRKEPWRKVIIISPSAVHEGFKREFSIIKFPYTQNMHRIHLLSNKAFNLAEQIYKITTGVAVYAASELEQTMKTSDLNEYIVIYDESHSFVNSVCGASKNSTYIYESIMKSPKCRRFFLTGSLIVKDFFEIVPYVNMCSGALLLPEIDSLFRKYFMDYKSRKFMNIGILRSLLFGWFSFYGDVYLDGSKTSEFAELLREKIIKVRMSKSQFQLYDTYRAEEIKDDLKQKEFKSKSKGNSGIVSKFKQLEGSTSYRIYSRQACNLAPFDKSVIISYALENCPKLHHSVNLADKLITEGKKGAIFSNFTNQVGLRGIEFLLREKGYQNIEDILDQKQTPKPVRDNNSKTSKTYAILTGDTPKERRIEIQNIYNDQNNMHGEVLPILLFSVALAEGVSFYDGRFIIILDYFFNESRIDQVIARLRRRGGHKRLPEAERTLQPYVLLSIPPLEFDKVETTDQYLFRKAELNQELLDRGITLVKESTINCTLMKALRPSSPFSCFTCNNVGLKLYTPGNFERDIKTNYTPCASSEKEATEFMYEGKKYYYVAEDDEFYTIDNDGSFIKVDQNTNITLKKAKTKIKSNIKN
jgi:hypothetical protein